MSLAKVLVEEFARLAYNGNDTFIFIYIPIFVNK
jgi:hypothetical protein